MLKAGVVVGDITSADVTALDLLAAYEVGYWVDDNGSPTGSSVLDAIANSVGAWWGVDGLGKFRMGQIKAPIVGDSIGTLTGVDIIKIDRTRSGRSGRGRPGLAGQTKLQPCHRYSPIWRRRSRPL